MHTIGKYKEIYNDNNLPSIYENISDTPIKHKKEILDYLKSGKITAVAPSCIKDIISGKAIKRELMMMNDGKYAWRSDLIYYFEKYNLKLPDKFVKEVLNLK